LELIAEYDPPRDRRLIEEGASALSRVYDLIDIPDAPLGKPNYSSPVYSAFLAALGYRVVAHLRVSDVNLIAMKNITKSLGTVGVEKLVYLRGDPPYQGLPVDHVTPEEAVRYALRRPEAPEPGLLLSLRKPLDAIAERISVGARFYYVLNHDWRGGTSWSKLESVARLAHSRGARVYVYAPASPAPHPEALARAATIVDGLVVSAPGAPAQALVEAANYIRRVLK